LWGDFFSIYKRVITEKYSWPENFTGLESLRHWRILKDNMALMINRPALIVHRQVPSSTFGDSDNLTGSHSAIKRGEDMTNALQEFINEHTEAWLEYCPSQLGRYECAKAMYQLLGGGGYPVRALYMGVRLGDRRTKAKSVLLLCAFFLPLELRRKVFIYYSRWMK